MTHPTPENLYVYNATMVTTGDAARIKVYGGIPPNSTSLSSGGGTGIIRNVTYSTVIDQADNCKFRIYLLICCTRRPNSSTDAIELTQCYGQTNITACNLYPVSCHLQFIIYS